MEEDKGIPSYPPGPRARYPWQMQRVQSLCDTREEYLRLFGASFCLGVKERKCGQPIAKIFTHDSVASSLRPSDPARIMSWSPSLTSPHMFARCIYRNKLAPSHPALDCRRAISTALHFYSNKQLELYAAKEAKPLTLRQLVRDSRTNGASQA